ncbi:hypothetical protein NDU88_002092 [Pleurodeles waltl]|uniref:Uncharacterized protein n=1 Tax=Pleurodeles waltl TaxID=8319 RepID=A0AAV7RAX7_PLEWA|nr:hypothetical protein NDU88_002092 [Pleurodeles waltl]
MPVPSRSAAELKECPVFEAAGGDGERRKRCAGEVLRQGRARRNDAPLGPWRVMVLPGMMGYVVSLGDVVRCPGCPSA